ncbi:TLD domain-containing protein 2 isoform X2 [Amborella trichopoda]|uniref:TLD domain-containing protein 2 isoform X2 n=1 Tax=Amborella trichopoda TaxID=13333 RepID=UPI0009C06010|nr:TLD domain-containing protein 2 isoform X2 [Amborella trichopoda]|eukprot:XP_020531408.1 TLD domain-containing protein 2 isoform X2 [Amborella trichopoda]
MSCELSFRNKAAHFVSDLTTVLLNPISDIEENETKSRQHMFEEKDFRDEIDGPDTSSFGAFLYSLLSSESGSDSGDKRQEHNAGMTESASNLGTQAIAAMGAEEALPDISEPSLLLSERSRTILCSSLPKLVCGSMWVLIYSTWRHGISLSSLYRRSTLCPGYCMLVVGDRKGAVFGGLVEAPLRPTNKRKYQGTTNAFVFSDVSSSPVVFRPTGINRYFTLCSTDFLALGGGGHFALYLEEDLLHGSSSASETFGNSCLAHTQDFEVKEVELWGFRYTSKHGERVSFDRLDEPPGICRW